LKLVGFSTYQKWLTSINLEAIEGMIILRNELEEYFPLFINLNKLKQKIAEATISEKNEVVGFLNLNNKIKIYEAFFEAKSEDSFVKKEDYVY